MHVGDARFRVVVLDQVGNRVHEMGLAETDAAVEKQRVIGPAGILRDLQRGRLGELIALAFDESPEAEIRIEARTDDQTFGAPRGDTERDRGTAQRYAA